MSLIVLGAVVLRLVMLARFPFREDEAAYAYWALHGWIKDPMFLQVWPDKPPVFLWLLEMAFRLFGVSEASARLVSIAASTLTVPLIAAIAYRLWGRRAAFVAAAVLALSPYAISFAPTAYTDSVLLLAGTAAFCAAVYNRSFISGLLLGLAVMTKQQGVLFAPLVLGTLWLVDRERIGYSRSERGVSWLRFEKNRAVCRKSVFPAVGRSCSWSACRSYVTFLAGLALVLLPILYWDSLRWSVAPSPWDLAIRNYATVAVLGPTAWPARLTAWGPHIFALTASWTNWAVLSFIVGMAILATRRQTADQTSMISSSKAHPPLTQAIAPHVRTWRDGMIWLVVAWSLGFLAIHLVGSVQTWDRYLLPLAPMLALVASWAVSRLGPALDGGQAAILAFVAALLLVPPAQLASTGQLAVGGDHGDYVGLPEALRAVENSSQGPFVLYHKTLGSHYRFYLYERSQMQPPTELVELRWFPSPVYLADNAAKTPTLRKFVIVPDWSPVVNLRPHLAMRGLSLSSMGRYGHFTVWEVMEDRSESCARCASGYPYRWQTVTGKKTQASPARP